MESEEAKLYSDLIKIGIPSLIALVGAISSVILAIKGHKKDLLIERMRSEKELRAERHERKGNLIQEIALGITQLHNALMQYATLYSAKLETDLAGETFPPANRTQLSEYYQSLTDTLHVDTPVKTNILLLGSSHITRLFDDYWSSVSKFSYQHRPAVDTDYDAVTRRTLRINEKQEALFKHLSKVYLLEECEGAL